MLAFNDFILLWSRDTTGLMDDSFIRIKGWNTEFRSIVTTNYFDGSRELVLDKINEGL
jgi:hypothetical protein